MKRRNFLLLSALGIGGAGVYFTRQPPIPGQLPEHNLPKGKMAWRNWSGYLACAPEKITAPRTEQDLVTLLKGSKGPIRPVGAGHSFTPLVPTEGTIVSLRRFHGMLSHDAANLTATFRAGTKLGQVGEPLHAVGQALPNMPDIDEQSLAGALATATHGTGAKHGAMHDYVRAMKLVTPNGDILRCSADENSDLFNAAKVSLGSLGFVTEITLQNIETLRLKRTVKMWRFDDLMDAYNEYVDQNHSVDTYFIPFMDYAFTVTINPTDEPIKTRGVDPDNDAVEDMKMLRDRTGRMPWLRRQLLDMAAQDFEPEESVDVWHKVYPSERAVRFNEMEYHLDRRQLVDTMRKVKAAIEEDHDEAFFPCEVRVVKGDDTWISPFYGHDHGSGSIAIHRYFEEDPRPYFAGIEPIFKAANGRPHWGKMNTLTNTDFARLYPKWEDFQRVRKELDPTGKMLNEYLAQIFS